MNATQLLAPLAGTLVSIEAAEGASVQAGQTLAYIESMKMEHALAAPCAGLCGAWLVSAGDLVDTGQLLLKIEQQSVQMPGQRADLTSKGNLIESLAAQNNAHPNIGAWQARQALTQDAARPEAIAKRHSQGNRSARENVAHLCGTTAAELGQNPATFAELGALAYAAQTQRRSADELRTQTPADGMVTGIGAVNAELLAPGMPTQTAILAYDATFLAGTQGMRNHQKTDRLLQIAAQRKLPVVVFAEGGGGRPGDVDFPIVAGLHVPTFAALAKLRGKVPSIAVVHGRCFAGNAALAGMCDVLIATEGANLGLGGPAMVEGGGLGRFAPEQIGPASLHAANGGIDLLATDEGHATRLAKQVLAHFQGPLAAWQAPDAAAQTALRGLVPAQRNRAFDALVVLQGVVDVGSVLELGAAHGQAVHTVLARLQGRSVGLVVSNPQHLGGALDAAACHKLTRFLALCQRRGLPVGSFIDTPGFMVGPEAEAQGTVRASGDLFCAAATLTVPRVAVVLRRGFGLGAMALAVGGFHEPQLMCAWPSAECGAMGLEGAVKLGYKKELDACATQAEREAMFQQLLQRLVQQGGAIQMAETLEIDTVIDPAATRAWVVAGLGL